MNLKGIVVDLEKNRAAVLFDDGYIGRVKNKNYRIGDTVDLGASRRSGRKLSTLAASLVAALMLGGMSTWAYAAPYTSVSLDANPSIVLDVNRFDKVISYQVNDDGKQTLETDLKNMNINDAVAAVIKELKDDNIIDENNFEDMVITVSGKNSERTYKLLASLEKEVSEAAKAEGFDDVNIETEGTGFEMVQRAREYAEENDAVLTPGKLNLITKMYPEKDIQDLKDNDINEYADMTVQEIMKQVKAMRANGADMKAAPEQEDKITGPEIQKGNKGDRDEETEE